MHRTLPFFSLLLLSTAAWAGDPAPRPVASDPAAPAPAPAPAPASSEPAAPPPAPASSSTDGEEAAPSKPTSDEAPEEAATVRAVEYADIVTLGGVAGGSSDVRSYAKDWLVAPPGWNVGGELRFIAASTSLDGPRVKFTDLALLRFHSRLTVSRRIELSGAIDLMSKQPDTRHDTILQGGRIGMKIAANRRTAIAAGAAGGPTMGDTGFWGAVATGALHRSRIEEFLAFQFGGGAIGTGVRMDDVDPIWQADLNVTSELIFHTPKGEFATWGGVEMAFPVVHSDNIEPSSRLDVTAGMVYAAARDWDIYTAFTWRDRGSTMLPETTLPIVDGGFDQRQIIVGITRRFTERGSGQRWALKQ